MAGTGSWKHIKKEDCPHIGELNEMAGSETGACEVCGETSDLRICMTCGRVFCCESHNSHNTVHFKETGHPFIKPHNSDYHWLWCYKCNAFLE